jgi:hypothetical protein
VSDVLDRISADIDNYIRKLCHEKELLIAAYMQETGLKPSEIVLIVRDDRFYPAPREPKLDDIAPEIRRLKVRNALLEKVAEAAQTFLHDFCHEKTCAPGALQRALAALEAEG